MSNCSTKIYKFSLPSTEKTLDDYGRLYATGEECEFEFMDDKGFLTKTRGYVCGISHNGEIINLLVKTIYGFGGAHGGEMRKIVMPADSYQGSEK